MKNEEKIKKILILGAGFGGLTAALKLGKSLKKGKIKNTKIILVDQNAYHTYTPTLYEAAATSKDVANYIKLKSIITMPIDEIIKDLPIKFINEKISKIDIGGGNTVYLDDGSLLTYDYLVIAVGSETNFFDIPGLEENALKLKTLNDAFKIKDAVWNRATDGDKEKELNIVVAGGGVGGVELASELGVWLCGTDKKGKEHKKEVNIKLIEGGKEILKGFDSRIVESVKKRFKKIGIEIQTNKKIASVEKGGSGINGVINTDDGSKIPYDVFIWTGGVTSNKLLKQTSLKLKDSKVNVDNEMVCIDETENLLVEPKIFAIGDNVCTINKKTGMPVPMVARAAIDQAKIVATNIEREINSKQHKLYDPYDYPYVMAIGGKYAIAKIGNFIIKGYLAWFLKGLVELNYLLSIMPKIKAIKIWLKGFFIFMKNDRLG